MALQRSVLNTERIQKLIKDYYNINILSVKKLKLGTANCYRISDETQTYFLKEFQKGFSKDDLAREANLTDFLIKNQFPTARFYRTIDNSVGFIYDDSLICLQEFVEGTTFGYNDFPKEMLPELAEKLGKMHQILRDYPLPTDMGEKWLKRVSSEAIIAGYEALIPVAEQRTNDSHRERILSDLKYKKKLVARSEEFKKHYKGITYLPTHGDYQGCQLVCENGHIKAVIDFSSACRLPVAWEIMRSYVQSSSICRTQAHIDIADFCEYVATYMRFSPLTSIDLASMPYVYLFQLCISKYGYPQYLKTDSEDREGLLQFAFWRTDICREIEEKAEEISRALVNLGR